MQKLTYNDLAWRWQVSIRTVRRWRARWPRRLAGLAMTRKTILFSRAAVEQFEKWKGGKNGRA